MITSLDNKKIKSIMKLKQKKYRTLTNTYVVEGKHLVEEAFKNNYLLEVFTTNDNYELDISKTIVSEDVMKHLSSLTNPPEVIGVCKMKEDKLMGNRILLLDEIRDPGNLGTIIRSAVAFNIDTIVLSDNTVDLYNPKVLRATEGMYLQIPIIKANSLEIINKLKQDNYKIYGTNVNLGLDVRSLTKVEKEKFCLIMGNEGSGVSEDIQKMCDKNLYIPIKKSVESLNVSIACSILLYELGR